MRRAVGLVLALLVALPAAAAPVVSEHRTDDPDEPVPIHDHEYPLAKSKLLLRDGGKRGMRFHGRWSGVVDDAEVNPTTTGAILRVSGARGDEGDSGTIQLPAEGWTRKGRKLRYSAPDGGTGGIRKVVLKLGKKGGAVTIRAGTDTWRYRLDTAQTAVTVTLEIGTSRWCAEYAGSELKQRGTTRVAGKASVGPAGCECDALVAGTWDAMQSIFDKAGCTQAVCHGAAPGEGDLDLRREVAFEQLVGIPSTIDPGLLRVRPGDAEDSLLWQKLAARTEGLTGVPGSGMPVGAAPLTDEELRIVSLWIYNGAPERGIVPGSERLLAASCTPAADPPKIPPPDPPAPTEGVQLHGPAWTVPANGEGEVCYATYYDVSATVPSEFLGPCPDSRGGPGRECLFFNRAELIQDPNSHHSIPRTYVGVEDITHPSFGPFTCHGGPMDGEPCDPKGLGSPAPAGAECGDGGGGDGGGGDGGGCAGRVVPSIACLTYGPPDFSQGFNLAESAGAPDILVATEPRHVLELPSGVMDAIPSSGTLVWNSHAFNPTNEPTTNEQWLRFFFAPPEEQIFLLQDFFHVRDIFIIDVAPFERAQYCTTLTFEPGTRLFDLMSHTHKRGALFELWGPGGVDACESFSDPSCGPDAGEPTLRTTDFADPDRVTFDPPLELDGDAASRTVKYCAVYDNGFTDPTTVKRKSTAPPGAVTCDAEELACLAGPNQGELCGGDDAFCDSSPGAGDGLCDACPVHGWVTADDEMFVLLGSYYCPDGIDCVLPSELPRTLPPELPGL